MKYNKMIQWIMCFVVVSGACVWGVTDQEVKLIQDAMPDKAVAQPQQERAILVFSLCKGFKHSSIPYWKQALDVMSEKTGAFKVVHSDDMNIFTAESLKQFDVICFNNTTQLVPDQDQQKAIMGFIRSGKGIVGIHAATDSFYEWPAGMKMMGGVFKGHPWGGGGTWAIKIDDAAHPLMKSFKGQGFKIKDEIYRTAPPLYSRKNQRVLMSLDMSDPTTRNADGVEPDDMDTGISWIKPVGGGRLFYCSLGHDHAVTWNSAVLWHYLAGIQYALGDLDVDDNPIPAGAAKLDTATLNNLIAQLKEYDWDKDRQGVVQLQGFIQDNFENTEAIKTIEGELVAVLSSDASFAAKDFVCRQLATMGTEVSVPALVKMLSNAETANIARYALERIPAEAAGTALLAELNAVDDETTKIGIITSLGIRGSQEAVQALSKYTKDSNDAIAIAAIQALGFIGTEQAADALNRVNAGSDDALNLRLLDAQLACAQSLVEEGMKYPAQRIYRKVYGKSNPSVYRAAGLIGLAEAGSRDAKTLIPEAIKGDDVIVQAAGIKLVSTLKDASLLKTVAASLSELSEAAQIQVIAALAENPQKIGKAEIEKAASSENKAVRIAAYQGLAMLGDGRSVQLLAKASESSDRDESQAAKEALYRVSGNDVDSTILGGITSDLDVPVRVALIRAAVIRKIDGAVDVLFKTAMSDERKIASESIRGLQTLGQAEDVAKLVDLLVAKPSSQMEIALIVVAGKIEDQNQRSKAILAKYPTINKVEAKATLLRVMGKLGDAHAVSTLKKEYASKDATIKEAAFRGMASWPGSDFMTEMKEIAQSSDDAKSKVLAFRGYVRMLADSGQSTDEIVDGLIGAYDLIDIENEQRRVVSVLGRFSNDKSLAFLKKAYEGSSFKAEAEVSLVAVCEKMAWTNSSVAKVTLEQVMADTQNESVQKGAKAVLDQINSHDGFVMGWEVSGPYKAEGKDGEALFDVAFDPEKDSRSGQWQSAMGLISNQKGIFDLAKLEKADDCAAYMKTTLPSDQDKDAVLEVGSDDGVKVWLNGDLVHANNAARPVVPGQDKVKVKLKKGNNDVLVKVIQRQSNWGFCMKVVE